MNAPQPLLPDQPLSMRKSTGAQRAAYYKDIADRFKARTDKARLEAMADNLKFGTPVAEHAEEVRIARVFAVHDAMERAAESAGGTVSEDAIRKTIRGKGFHAAKGKKGITERLAPLLSGDAWDQYNMKSALQANPVAIVKDTRKKPRAYFSFKDKKRAHSGRSTHSSWRERRNPVIAGTGKTSFSTYVHEYGHYLEDAAGSPFGQIGPNGGGGRSNPIKLAATDLLKRRTAGKPLEKLSDLTGSSFYADSEVTRDGGFLSYYASKEYESNGGRLPSTELISMGLEWITKPASDPGGINALTMLDKDPEHFGMMVSILTGRIRL